MIRFLGWEIRRSQGAPFINPQYVRERDYCICLLVQACQSAEALYHRLRVQNKLSAGDQIVGDQLIEALHLARRLGL